MTTGNFEYCPNCGQKYKTPNLARLECDHCLEVSYKNSKPTASLLIIKDDQVLLTKRALDPHKGELDTPGGFLDFGETAEAAAIREAKEELNVDIELTEFFGTFTSSYSTHIKTLDIFFLAKIISGTLNPNDDVAELVWMPIRVITSTTCPFAGVQAALDKLKSSYLLK